MLLYNKSFKFKKTFPLYSVFFIILRHVVVNRILFSKVNNKYNLPIYILCELFMQPHHFQRKDKNKSRSLKILTAIVDDG